MVDKEKHLLVNFRSWLLISLATTTFISTLLISFQSISNFQTKSQSKVAIPINSPSPIITGVAALGRLEPQGEIIRLSAPNSLGGGIRIAKLLVKKGDKIRQGQLIAFLDSYSINLAALEKAKRQVEVAKANLEKVEAGAKQGDIYAQKAIIARLQAELRGETSAQKAIIARLQAELNNAQRENQRYEDLYENGAISASNAESKRLRRDTLQQQINEAKAALNRTQQTLQKQLNEAQARLNSIVEIRPTDLQLAKADLASAKASVIQAQAELDLTIIRSPIDGQVLKINAWPGEIISSQGIAELGRTQQMYVVAEVYETDVKKVKLGQSVDITADAFSGKIQGTVTDIGLQVNQQNIFNNRPGADTDNKIVDVKIRINNPKDNQKVADLTNLQVQVWINM
ncbi:MAG: ABC exporter membrane fusion protein [Cylindrospermopsis raciborskii 1523720]|jgi:HlyD family secretion protein|uniref:ABC exporter membrane fusion protein n=1 Tax=Cylindrospermopsis raciborskii TaxID=77022 RepID=UPI001F360BF2|nr:ABC exporter membrane fusion protein [Cylindrospermopsis raciborskii]MEB3146684.1 ABC exporter membrane fusion protein [Cylindrospermopsis raciborskii]UJS03363.1 ABC exporter membrane fusion protein [Cylindrospermopsis raciborskii KLL07]